MVVKEIENESQFQEELESNFTKLVVVHFFVTWSGPCRFVSPYFFKLSNKLNGRAVFLEVNIDKCLDLADSEGVTVRPTFILYHNMVQVAKFEDGNLVSVEAKIVELYEAMKATTEDCGIPGHMNLNSFIMKTQCEALNDSDSHPLSALIDNSGYIESDCDQQLILSFTFTRPVKVHFIKVKAPKENGPKSLKLFINQPNTIDFEAATYNLAAEKLDLKPDELDGKVVNLKYLKFQNIYNLQIFVINNQTEADITRIDSLDIIGILSSATNMSDFKRVSGKVGEVHV